MLEENTVPTSNGHFAIALGVPGKTNARRRIEQMPLQTTRVRRRPDAGGRERCECRLRNSGSSAWTAALDDSIERIPGSSNKRSVRGAAARVNCRRVGSVKGALLEVIGLAVTLAVGTKEAEPQPEIQSKFLGHPPVVLEIRLYDPVTVVILNLQIGLLVLRDIPHQQIGKGISCANGGVAGIERQDALDVGRVLLVLLRKREIGTELQGMRADDLGHIVAIGINGVGVIPREVAGIGREPSPVRYVVPERNCRKLPAKAVIE